MIFIEHMRQYPFNVGIVPMPKYTEEQEHYCQFADGYCSSFAGIPVTNTAPADAALLLDALSYESVSTLTPAYYEICLTGKSLRDTESADMLDIIFNSYIIVYLLCCRNSVRHFLNHDNPDSDERMLSLCGGDGHDHEKTIRTILLMLTLTASVLPSCGNKTEKPAKQDSRSADTEHCPKKTKHRHPRRKFRQAGNSGRQFFVGLC